MGLAYALKEAQSDLKHRFTGSSQRCPTRGGKEKLEKNLGVYAVQVGRLEKRTKEQKDPKFSRQKRLNVQKKKTGKELSEKT